VRHLNILRAHYGPLSASRQGAVAVLFALTLVPLMIGAGMATDFARAQILRSSLQTIADSSALAGASELNQNQDPNQSHISAISIATSYFNKSTALLMNSGAVGAPTVTAPNSFTVKVSVTATLKTTLMSLFTPTVPMSVSATAEGPGYALQIAPGSGFSSSASDANTIFFYTVPAGGGRPPIDATASNYKPLFSNSAAYRSYYNINNATASIAVGSNDQVGFALYNVTGGVTPYPNNGTNAYGAANNTTHGFFSSLSAPSMDPGQFPGSTQTIGYPRQPAYSVLSNKCAKTAITTTTSSSLTKYADPCGVGYPCVTKVGTALFQNNLMVNNKCSTPSSAILTCLQLYETPTSFSWGDMGGSPDDFDYANADYTVQCVPNTTGTASAGQPSAVILVQ